jgi:hypothetical protein
MSKNTKNQTTTLHSFKELAAHMREQDIAAAQRLKQTQHLRKPGTLAIAKVK